MYENKKNGQTLEQNKTKQHKTKQHNINKTN